MVRFFNQTHVARFVTLLVFLLAQPVSGSVNWDGPVDAAISRLASFLNSVGVQGAGVRPLGYRFAIGDWVIREDPEDEQDEENEVENEDESETAEP